MADAVADVHAVVNAVSLYTERGTETFHSVHVECAERVATEAHRAGVEQLVHVSGSVPTLRPAHPMSATAVKANGLSGSCPGGQSRCSLGPPGWLQGWLLIGRKPWRWTILKRRKLDER